MASTVQLLSRLWQAKLVDLLASSEESLLIAAPYIKRGAAEWLLDELSSRRRGQAIETTIMTDISPASVLDAGLDIHALVLFADRMQPVTIFDVHRLHAKVYVADEKQAIITSGNLTSSAFTANYEYGVIVTEHKVVKKVRSDMDDYARAGRQVSQAELARLEEVSRDFVGQYQRSAGRLGTGARRELTREWNKIAVTFEARPGLREAGSTRFKGPIIEVLTSRGPLITEELCEVIQSSWPSLCDDSLMRVAKDGTRKRRWRHDIHVAQETLQRSGLLRRDAEGLWHIGE